MEGIWVFGGIDEDKSIAPKAFMVPVENRSAATLMTVIKARILPGSTIYSDLWKAYSNIDQEGYNHGTVNHSKEFKSAQGVHTNNIEGLWGKLNIMLMTKMKSILIYYCSKYLIMIFQMIIFNKLIIIKFFPVPSYYGNLHLGISDKIPLTGN